MAELRNLQNDHETALGGIYHVELVRPTPLAVAMGAMRPLVVCNTAYGYSIDLSLEEIIEIGEWWEANKERILAVQKEENNAK